MQINNIGTKNNHIGNENNHVSTMITIFCMTDNVFITNIPHVLTRKRIMIVFFHHEVTKNHEGNIGSFAARSTGTT